MQEKIRDLCKEKSWLLQYDNAPAYNALSIETNFVVLGEPPYSPNLALCDLFYFVQNHRNLQGDQIWKHGCHQEHVHNGAVRHPRKILPSVKKSVANSAVIILKRKRCSQFFSPVTFQTPHILMNIIYDQTSSLKLRNWNENFILGIYLFLATYSYFQ